MGKYDNVTAKEYFEKKKEMLNDLGRIRGFCSGVKCKECPLYSLELPCYEREYNNSNEAVKIVMEYEPKVDWNKVAVDTKILVRQSRTDDWHPRHFAKYEGGKIYAFYNGKTSFTSYESDLISWEYAKLYEGD